MAKFALALAAAFGLCGRAVLVQQSVRPHLEGFGDGEGEDADVQTTFVQDAATAIQLLDPRNVTKLLRQLTGVNTTTELLPLVGDAFSSDRLLGRLEAIAPILTFNATAMEAITRAALNQTVKNAKASSFEFIIPIIQEFYMGQKDLTEKSIASMTKVMGFIHTSMPPKTKEVVAPHLDKFVAHLELPEEFVVSDYDEFVSLPKSKFCKAMGRILRNTSLVADKLEAQIVEVNATRDMLPSLMKAAVAPDRVAYAVNVTTAFATAFSATFQHLRNNNNYILKEIGYLAEHRVHCDWKNA